MKTLKKACSFLIIVLLLTNHASIAQTTTVNNHSTTENQTPMKTYLIERNIPDAGKFTQEQLQAISQKSCSVLNEMGPEIQWIQSYVVGDKIFCVYKAANEDLIREHGEKGGFPVTNIYEVKSIISPATAKGQ